MTARISSAGELIAAIPHLVGYHPDEGSMAVVAMNPQGSIIGVGIAQLDEDNRANGAVEYLSEAAQSMSARGEPIRSVALAYYGDPTDLDAATVLESAYDTFPDVPLVAAFCVTNTQFRFIGEQPHGSGEVGWSPAAPVPAASMVADLPSPDPAATPEEFYRRNDPYPQALFRRLDEQTQEQLDRMAPSLKVEVATRSLDRLGDQLDPHSMAVLAHLAENATVQDYLLVHAAQSPTRIDALLEVFKSAPASHRTTMAGLAGGSMYLSSASTRAVERVLTHAQSEPHSLAGLFVQALAAGVDDRQVLRELRASATPQRLERADRTWERDHRLPERITKADRAHPPQAVTGSPSHDRQQSRTP